MSLFIRAHVYLFIYLICPYLYVHMCIYLFNMSLFIRTHVYLFI